MNAPPEYPASSRRNAEQGTVRLAVEITALGTVAGVEVARSSGHPALDEAARRAVARWRFEPAMRDGVPVSATAQIAITFRLQGSSAW